MAKNGWCHQWIFAESKMVELPNYSPGSNEVLQIADNLAKEWNHSEIDTGHLLAALAKYDQPLFEGLNLPADRLKVGISLAHLPVEEVLIGPRQFTEPALKAISSDSSLETVRPSHILAKILKSKKSRAVWVLENIFNQSRSDFRQIQGVAASLKTAESDSLRSFLRPVWI